MNESRFWFRTLRLRILHSVQATINTLFEAFFCYYSQPCLMQPPSKVQVQLACQKKNGTPHTVSHTRSSGWAFLCQQSVSVCWVMIIVRSQIHNRVCSVLTLQPGNRLTPRVRSSPTLPCGTRFSNHPLQPPGSSCSTAVSSH